MTDFGRPPAIGVASARQNAHADLEEAVRELEAQRGAANPVPAAAPEAGDTGWFRIDILGLVGAPVDNRGQGSSLLLLHFRSSSLTRPRSGKVFGRGV